MREQIQAVSDSDWKPLIDRQGEIIDGEETCRTSFCIGEYERPFTLIVQRKAVKDQAELDLVSEECTEEIAMGGYIYRSIATNHEELTDSEIVHWYSQRAEDSENRIKELKLDFGGDTLPCSQFKANEVYFFIAALSCNLFALMRQLLPGDLASHRAVTIRWRLYAVAAKVVKTGRQLCVKLRRDYYELLNRVIVFATSHLVIKR